MGRITRKEFDRRYSKLREASNLAGEHNDCAVVAIAAVANCSYEEAHGELEDLGRRKGKGTSNIAIDTALDNLGCKVTHHDPYTFIQQYPGRAKLLKNVTTHHPDRYNEFWSDGKRYLFFTKQHVGAVIDGVNIDWTRGRAKHVWRILEVQPPVSLLCRAEVEE